MIIEHTKMSSLILHFPTAEEQMEFLEQHLDVVHYITDEQTLLEILQRNPQLIEFVREPTEQVQLAVVQQDGKLILFIENPTEQVQLAAVQQDGNSIHRIRNPTEQVRAVALKQGVIF